MVLKQYAGTTCEDWKAKDSYTKAPLVARDLVCKPKKCRGGIEKSQRMEQSTDTKTYVGCGK